MTAIVANATPLVRAIDATIAGRLALPIDRVADPRWPDRCPAELLGLLAWQLSIDLWDDAWPETKKRQVCADALRLHRSKTTLAGIRAHIALTGSELVRAIRPPATRYRRSTMSADERETWLAGLPQIRVYPFLTPGIVKARSFRRGFVEQPIAASFDADWTFDATYPAFDSARATAMVPLPQPFGPRVFGLRGVRRSSRGAELSGLRTTFVDGGAEIEVTREPVGDAARFYLPRTTRRSFRDHGFAGVRFRTSSSGDRRTFTVRAGDDAASFAVAVGMAAVDVRPLRVFARRIAPVGRRFHGQAHRGRGFTQTSFGPHLVYDCIPLVAPDRTAPLDRATSFHGHGRRGMASFTAELLVSVPMHRPRARSGRWHGSGFRQAADMTPVARMLEAVRVSKAQRDTILIDTTTQRQVRFGDGLSFGDFTFGEIRKVA